MYTHVYTSSINKEYNRQRHIHTHIYLPKHHDPFAVNVVFGKASDGHLQPDEAKQVAHLEGGGKGGYGHERGGGDDVIVMMMWW
jgi:hypothetical protein